MKDWVRTQCCHLSTPSQWRRWAKPPVKQLGAWIAMGCVMALAGSMALAQAQRVVQGKVLGSQDEAVAGAIVYLKDSKTNTIKTSISTQDGSYRFGQLSSGTDYSLWAQMQGKKSATRAISSFDSKAQFNIDLKINTSK